MFRKLKFVGLVLSSVGCASNSSFLAHSSNTPLSKYSEYGNYTPNVRIIAVTDTAKVTFGKVLVVPVTNVNCAVTFPPSICLQPQYIGGGNIHSGGTVNVRGYTRANGTYVAPHTRSAPRPRR